MLAGISCIRIVFLCNRWLWWGSVVLILHIRIIWYWHYLPCSLYQTCLVCDTMLQLCHLIISFALLAPPLTISPSYWLSTVSPILPPQWSCCLSCLFTPPCHPSHLWIRNGVGLLAQGTCTQDLAVVRSDPTEYVLHPFPQTPFHGRFTRWCGLLQPDLLRLFLWCTSFEVGCQIIFPLPFTDILTATSDL